MPNVVFPSSVIYLLGREFLYLALEILYVFKILASFNQTEPDIFILSDHT